MRTCEGTEKGEKERKGLGRKPNTQAHQAPRENKHTTV